MDIENWGLNVLKDNNIIDVRVIDSILDSILLITDLNKLQITKIRYDKLYFKYNEQRYFVVANYDCGDSWYSLYKKSPCGKSWNVKLITTSGWCNADIKYLLDDKSRRSRNIVYSHIDKKFFVEQLVKNNLVKEGMNNEKIK